MDFETQKITSKGQVTIPVDIRKKLGLKGGDNVAFVTNGKTVYISKASVEALNDLIALFAGAADKLGSKNDDDVVAYIKQLRKEDADK
jgi:antitoxin PrlF